MFFSLGVLLPALLLHQALGEDPYEAYLNSLEKRHLDYRPREPIWDQLEALQQQHGIRDGAAAVQFPEAYWRELVKQMDELGAEDPVEEARHYLEEEDHEPDQMNFNTGEHKVSGGAGEGTQQLGPMGQYTNTQESKSDQLPSYCHPPNPCPLGYSPDTFDSPCESHVEDTKEFNRQYIWNKMADGECTCDTEHMRKCPGPANPSNGDPMSPSLLRRDNPYLSGEKRQLVAKKNPINAGRVSKRAAKFSLKVKAVENPWMKGEILNTVEKKAGPVRHHDNDAM